MNRRSNPSNQNPQKFYEPMEDILGSQGNYFTSIKGDILRTIKLEISLEPRLDLADQEKLGCL